MVRSDSLFMGATSLIGILLMITTIMISLKTTACPDSKIQAIVQACLVVATTFIVVPVSYMVYRHNCGTTSDTETPLTVFAGVFLACGVGLLTGGGFLLKANSDDKDNTTCEDISIEAGAIVTAGALMTIFAIGYIAYEVRETAKVAGEKKTT